MKNISLRDLKIDTHEINDIEKIVYNFENNSALLDINLISQLKDKQISDLFLKIKFLHGNLSEKQLVSDRIKSLVYNIGRLRAAVVTSNKKEGFMIVDKFLKEGNMEIRKMISQNKSFYDEINELSKLYRNLSSKIIKIKRNASFIAQLDEFSHKSFLKDLRKTYNHQRVLLYNAGNYFVEFSRKAL